MILKPLAHFLFQQSEMLGIGREKNLSNTQYEHEWTTTAYLVKKTVIP